LATRLERARISSNDSFSSLPFSLTIHSAARALPRAWTSKKSSAQLNCARRGHSKSR
jgi:hypothetical protein